MNLKGVLPLVEIIALMRARVLKIDAKITGTGHVGVGK